MLRLVSCTASALAALALAGPALASYTPRLAVSHPSGATTIHVSIPQGDDPTAVIQIYAPTGYAIPALAAPGTTIGQASASLYARDTGLTLPLTGSVVAADPAAHTSDVCAPGAHLAVWLLSLEILGQQDTIPVYVDATTGAEAAVGSYRIRVCLPPPDVPEGTPGRATLGVQLLDTQFTLTSVFGGSSGEPWRATFTPYAAGTGVPNTAATVEARAFVGGSGAISLSTRYVRKTNAYRLGGSVTQAGKGVGGVKVTIYRGRSAATLVHVSGTPTSASGRYVTAGHLRPRRTTYFQTRVAVGERAFAAGCSVALAPLGVPCVGSTIGGFTAASAIVHFKV